MDEILRLSDDERVFPFILGVVAEMIDDGGAFVIELDATLGGQLLDGFADVGSAGDENVAAAVDEPGDGGHVELTAKLLHGGSEEDEVVVEELAIFDERQRGIIGRLKSQLESTV